MSQSYFDQNPLVSVIMPAYNAEKTIAEAIQSVIDQTYKNWELIVVDDGSLDRTAAVVQSFTDTRINLIKKENGGQSSARNKGITEANGVLIAFLDADDLWLLDKLSQQIAVFINCITMLGFVHTDYVEFDNRKENKPKPQKFVKRHQLKGYVYQDLIIHNFVGVLTVMVPKKVLDQVGLFDETLPNSPDWDLWLRITQSFPIEFIDSPLARYRLNPTGLSKNYEVYEKNLWKLLEKHLFKAEIPISRRNQGLWLYYRHMTHGFIRNGNFKKAIYYLFQAIKVKPLSFQNLLSWGYCLLKSSQHLPRFLIKCNSTLTKQ